MFENMDIFLMGSIKIYCIVSSLILVSGSTILPKKWLLH